ncbi:MBL fold metallo-hydrolase [Sulfolobus sp. A20]|uniref:MBL fold metallo-hydrolase n=1 Tax=Sulfolobaceae TaxID=118883 RepID=UPI0008460347|nr:MULTISPECIES: MBL fold metallo-hydrolase [unclassified Sulfolobus]TRM74483.1 MBL fold metallo-hydrolase [Sulfolobus sp. A20-N-F8]TRM75493.1 MBL fold metallo-hydrolase [Sulfolobus sp. B5]TRM93614.1 MBL fold metallo-hydrolase [Sulfolobus sp. A20-N-G8]TRM98253.1 MBL fold metallo-hydrolase [Sulfolobus sp. F1]AOL16678.1 MBL fold metallo-hydrolase [Sulfolobus sp. A20]
MPCRGLHAVPAGPPEFPEIVTVYVVCGDKMNVMIDAGVSNSIMDSSFLDKLDLVILTHIHIDHIGLLQEIINMYKNVKILVKSGFKKYLTSDEGVKRLNESARNVLGDLYYVYGEFTKIEQDKVIEVDGGENFDLGEGRILQIYHTPGHAKHHISVMVNDVLFTGDSAGAFFNGVVIPTTPPPLDYDEYVNSLKFQINLKPNMVGLAHGGIVSPNVLSRHLEQMINKDFSIGEIDIGGTAGEILRKQIEVNLRGLKVI